MRFQLCAPFFLAVLASSFARPCSLDRSDLKARSIVDHEDVALFHRDALDVDERDLISDRDICPQSTFDPVLTRSILQKRHKAPKPKTGNPLLYGKTPASKKTVQQAQGRKAAARQTVAANQQAKTVKRLEYANALSVVQGANRPPGFRVPKKPKKVPQGNMQRGQAKSIKGAASQKAANERKAQRKQPFRDAGAAYKKTNGLPGRPGNSKKGSKNYKGVRWTYSVPNAPDKKTGKATPPTAYSSKDVRTAVYNSHLFANSKVNSKPWEFQNRLEGPARNKRKPLKDMTGSGTEFPIAAKKGGYQGGDPGAARAIIQKDLHGGYIFKGVVAHDPRVPKGSPGHNDHHNIHPKKPVKQYQK